MSRKQFISAEAHLAKFDVTVQQAIDFISANLDKPEVIYFAAFENGVTNAMLSEMTQHSTKVISDYFISAGLEPEKLDYTSMLVNFDLGELETLVDFNDNVGILSNISLRDAVRPLVNTTQIYDLSFESVFPHIQLNDGIFDADELGVGHLTDVAATSENLESLFYGSLINIFGALDEAELKQIKEFPDDGNSEEFQMLLIEALSDKPDTVNWTDEQLVELVSSEAISVINELWSGNGFVGTLDFSYLGLATM